MRIKEKFKRLGHFWLPSAPKRQVPGTLSISDGGNIELEVTGHFHDNLDEVFSTLFDNDSADLKRIVGQVEGYGGITLDDCYYRGPFNSIGSPSKFFIHVGKVFTGVAYNEGEIPLFNTLTFSVEGIDEWVGISGINVDYQEADPIPTATISYQPLADVLFNLNDSMQLLITFKWTSPGFPSINEAGISQKTYFKLVSREARELSDFISVAEKITTFLCFATDQTVSLDGLSATSDNRCKVIWDGTTELITINIYYPSQSYSKEEGRIYQDYLLFGFEQIRNDAEERIKNWIEICEKMEPVLDLYFFAKMETQLSPKTRFLALVQGLEAYHRRTSNEKRMHEAEFEELVKNLIDQCPEEHREWLKGKLDNEVSLRQRLRGIIKPFNDIIGNRTKRESLADKIVNIRNYLTHYHQSSVSEAAEGEDLESLCLKMELLFQLHFLQLIGFRREQINFLLANSIPFERKIELL